MKGDKDICTFKVKMPIVEEKSKKMKSVDLEEIG